MLNLLTSLRLTSSLLLALFFWLAAFIPLVKPGGRPLIQILNRGLASDWFAAGSQVGRPLRVWFIGLALLMGFLAVNLTLCTWRRFSLRRGTRTTQRLMFLIHLVFGLTLLAHGAGFFQGWRPRPLILQAGETADLENGAWQLEIGEIVFLDDLAIFEKPRKKWTTSDFTYQKNGAEVILRRRQTEILRGFVSTYRPLRRGSLQITLLDFTPPPDQRSQPGVKLTVSRAPYAEAVLRLFHVLIALFTIYLIHTWKPTKDNRHEENK